MSDNKIDYYSDEMNARREKFNRIINGIDAVLMNNIAEVDQSVYENWEGKQPTGEECEWFLNDSKPLKRWCCAAHQYEGDEDENEETEHDEQCQFSYDDVPEIYQWFAVNSSDADYLKNHNQYITYSDMLDTYFWAITHFGTSWDYVDSMVNDILGGEL